MRLQDSRWIAWWYSAIALGFALLAISRAIVGEKPWLVAVRFVIALGFALLAAGEFRTKDRRR